LRPLAVTLRGLVPVALPAKNQIDIADLRAVRKVFEAEFPAAPEVPAHPAISPGTESHDVGATRNT
jgi:hypothetical protein